MQKCTPFTNPLFTYCLCSGHEQCHQTNNAPNSHPAPFIYYSSRTVILRDLGGPRRATLHDDAGSRTARPASIAARTAPASSLIPARAREPSLRASSGCRCCCVRSAGHGHRDAVTVHRNRRGGDGAGRQAAVATDLAAAAVVVGAALVVACRALRRCDCDGGGGGRCGGGDGG